MRVGILLVLASIAVFCVLAWRAPSAEAQHGDPPPPAGAEKTAPKTGVSFEDMAMAAGLDFSHRMMWTEQSAPWKGNQYIHGTGVLVADVNNDGFMDVLFLNQDGPNGLYLGRADGTFGNRAASAGIALDDRPCSGGAFGDFDNDGFVDLYVTSIRVGNVLFKNLGVDASGLVRFSDVTAKAGVADQAHSVTACWVDLDNDGFLDLYVADQPSWTVDKFDKDRNYWVGSAMAMHMGMVTPVPNQFFHNNGDGSFSNWTEKVGIQNDPDKAHAGMVRPLTHMPKDGIAQPAMQFKLSITDVAVTDYNDDGWIDLYVGNQMGRDILYKNRGDGTLEDATSQFMPNTSVGTFGVQWSDVDNNGTLDLYCVDMHSDMWVPTHGWDVDHSIFPVRYNSAYGLQVHDPLAPREEGHPYVYGNALYVNGGGVRSREEAIEFGLENWWPWGVVHGDFDLDGWQDFFVTAGMSWPYGYSPNFFYLNKGGMGFQETAHASGLEPRTGGDDLPAVGRKFARSSRSAAVIDGDNNGTLELVVQNWNDHANYYMGTVPEGRHWVGFRLRGTKVNRDAVGARVFVTSERGTQVQIVDSSCGYLSQSDPRLLFGLGTATKVSRVEVIWPGGKQQIVTEFHLDRYNEVVEAP